MKIIGHPTECHICSTRTETTLVKCKLCCDGEEHEFCSECATDYQTYRARFGCDPKQRAAFERLQTRRAKAKETSK